MTNKMRPVVRVWTDGSTTPTNPGPGGWAALLITKSEIAKDGKLEKVISGSSPHASNIRMELMGVLRALQFLRMPSIVILYTDSQYIVDGFRNITHRQKLLKSHYDTWGLILHYSQIHRIRINKVKAHSGEEGNERVDRAAKKAARGQEGDPFMTPSEKMFEKMKASENERVKKERKSWEN